MYFIPCREIKPNRCGVCRAVPKMCCRFAKKNPDNENFQDPLKCERLPSLFVCYNVLLPFPTKIKTVASFLTRPFIFNPLFSKPICEYIRKLTTLDRQRYWMLPLFWSESAFLFSSRGAGSLMLFSPGVFSFVSV